MIERAVWYVSRSRTLADPLELQRLIDKGSDLIGIGATFQLGNDGGSAHDPRKVDNFQTAYEQWRAQAKAQLTADAAKRFDDLYSNSIRSSVRRFVEDPIRRNDPLTRSNRYRRDGDWAHPFETYFQRPVTSQIQILKSALAEIGAGIAQVKSSVGEPSSELDGLHPNVLIAVKAMWGNGAWDSAVERAYKSLRRRIRETSGKTDLDGTQLMDVVFSPDRPLLIEDDRHQVRMGYHRLFSGFCLAYRNDLVHRDTDSSSGTTHGENLLTPAEARELLFFLSQLHRVVDRAKPSSSE
jgi:uncharacterized protein (TIGR02391 family)